MKNRGVRSRILELAKTETLLVPTCNGAYVPAEIAFGEHKNGKGNSGF
jgi:hypothetical protein